MLLRPSAIAVISFDVCYKTEGPRHKSTDLLDDGPSCRAKAAPLRALASQIPTPTMKAKLLKVAQEWDARASGYSGSTPLPPAAEDAPEERAPKFRLWRTTR